MAVYVLVFDCETTGLPQRERGTSTGPPDPLLRINYSSARLIQLAWQLLNLESNEVEAEGSNFVIPSGSDWQMHPMAESIHGISKAQLETVGKNLTDVLLDFMNAALRAHTLVCHNMDFDLNVVAAELIHNALIVGAGEYLLSKPRFCTMLSSVDLCRLPFPSGRSWGTQKYKWPKLVELHIFLFGKEFDGAHDALEDVRATVRCFIALGSHRLGGHVHRRLLPEKLKRKTVC